MLKNKCIYEWNFFPQKPKNLLFRTFSAIFIHFRDFLSPQSPSEVFLQNLTFLNLQYLTSWKKIRKSCWSGDLALQTERQTKSNLQDTSTRVGTHLVFGLHSNYILTAAEWWYIPVRFGWKYLYQKAWYKQKLQSVDKHQLGVKAAKMERWQ